MRYHTSTNPAHNRALGPAYPTCHKHTGRCWGRSSLRRFRPPPRPRALRRLPSFPSRVRGISACSSPRLLSSNCAYYMGAFSESSRRATRLGLDLAKSAFSGCEVIPPDHRRRRIHRHYLSTIQNIHQIYRYAPVMYS